MVIARGSPNELHSEQLDNREFEARRDSRVCPPLRMGWTIQGNRDLRTVRNEAQIRSAFGFEVRIPFNWDRIEGQDAKPLLAWLVETEEGSFEIGPESGIRGGNESVRRVIQRLRNAVQISGAYNWTFLQRSSTKVIPLLLLFAATIAPQHSAIPNRQPQLAARGQEVALTFGAGNTIYFAFPSVSFEVAQNRDRIVHQERDTELRWQSIGLGLCRRLGTKMASALIRMSGQMVKRRAPRFRRQPPPSLDAGRHLRSQHRFSSARPSCSMAQSCISPPRGAT